MSLRTAAGSLLVLAPAMLMAIGACGSSQPNAKSGDLPTNQEAFGGATCEGGRAPAEPDLAAWDSNARALLANQRRSGVVVVRYTSKGCDVELEVLPNCIADIRDATGKTLRYDYTPYYASERKLAHDKRELFAQLPLGAASLAGTVGAGQTLRADLVRVGMASLPPDAEFKFSSLRGSECQRATHVVARIYLGAMAMAAGVASEVEAAASVFGAGVGGTAKSLKSVGREEGDIRECDAARSDGKEHATCAVPLRLGLAAINGAVQGESVADRARIDATRCGRACKSFHGTCQARGMPAAGDEAWLLGCASHCAKVIDAPGEGCAAERDAFVACVLKERAGSLPPGRKDCEQGHVRSPGTCWDAEEAAKSCRSKLGQ